MVPISHVRGPFEDTPVSTMVAGTFASSPKNLYSFPHPLLTFDEKRAAEMTHLASHSDIGENSRGV